MAKIDVHQLSPLTDDELVAARSYASESGMYHLVYQSAFTQLFGGLRWYRDFIDSRKPAHLARASRERFELLSPATVYSGHGIGFGAVGALGHSDPRKFVGMQWQYRGVISTSSERQVAEDTCEKRAANNSTPVLLEFVLPTGFRLLPMSEIGSGDSEFEYLIPPHQTFKVRDAARIQIAGTPTLHLMLVPIE